MHSPSKKAALLILGITAIALSRTMFVFFNDPEGPNLLVVIGMAAILFFASLTAYSFNSPAAGLKKLLLAVLIQMLVVVCFFFFLK